MELWETELRKPSTASAATQTDNTELLDLRATELRLRRVTKELADLNHHVKRVESTLRDEMRDELKLRLKLHEKHTAEKLAFHRKTADVQLRQVRDASKSRLRAQAAQHRRDLSEHERAMRDRARGLEARALEAAHEGKQRAAVTKLLVQDNRQLHGQCIELKRMLLTHGSDDITHAASRQAQSLAASASLPALQKPAYQRGASFHSASRASLPALSRSESASAQLLRDSSALTLTGSESSVPASPDFSSRISGWIDHTSTRSDFGLTPPRAELAAGGVAEPVSGLRVEAR